MARAHISTVVASTRMKMNVQRNIDVAINVNYMDAIRNFISENIREENNMTGGTVSREIKQMLFLLSALQVILTVVLIIHWEYEKIRKKSCN